MKSKEFFGSHGAHDIDIIVKLFNENKDRIYYHCYTTSTWNNPKIREVVFRAIERYRKEFVYNGEPDMVDIFTTPAYKRYTANINGTKISGANIIVY